MKGFSTIALFSFSALAAAQFTFNNKDNTFACDKSQGLAAYCAGGDIIIRCSNGVGTAGNCNDNLAGEVPYGNNGLAGCYQSAPSSGDAACTKAGLVYPASGSGASRHTSPYPIPGTIGSSKDNNSTTSRAGPSTVNAPCTNITAPFTNLTAPSSGGAAGRHWSNTTTIVSLPAPAYTAGSGNPTTLQASPVPSAGFQGSTPARYTGDAASSKRSTSPYWAFAIFAVVALF